MRLRTQLLTLVVLLAIVLPVSMVQAEEAITSATQPDQCRALATRVEAHNQQVHQELRQIKRELALLNQNLEKPGAREIMGGIGFILGLFGVAALVSARRQGKKER